MGRSVRSLRVSGFIQRFGQQLAARHHDILAASLQAGNQKFVGLPHVAGGVLDKRQVELTDGAKGAALEDLHVDPALARPDHLAFHRDPVVVSLLQQMLAADTRNGPRETNFTLAV